MINRKNSSVPSIEGKKFLPAIAWFLLVLFLICLPADDVPKPGFDFLGFDKLIHATMFGGIVFLVCMAYKKAAIAKKEKLNIFIKITMATCVWGITTELIQLYFIPGRQFDWYDWAADSFGATIAYFVSIKFFV